MPELPEVETIVRQLAPVVAGQTITQAGSHPSAKFSSAADAIDTQIHKVFRRGKYILFTLSNQHELIVHLGMTGKLQLVRAPDANDAYIRAWWQLSNGKRLELHDVRRFGRVAVVRAGEYATLPTLAALGPEPLDSSFNAEMFWKASRASRRAIKTQLLSQRLLAGIGNIYADEALWRAEIHPAARQLTKSQAETLRQELAVVIENAIKHGGTTLRDYRSLDGSTGENQHHLECYGRHGEACLRCGEPLERMVIDGRGTTFCKSCQKR